MIADDAAGLTKVVYVGLEEEAGPVGDSAALLSLGETLEARVASGLVVQLPDRDVNELWWADRRPRYPLAAVVQVWSRQPDSIPVLHEALGTVPLSWHSFVVSEDVLRWEAPAAAAPQLQRPGVVLTALLFRAPTLTRAGFDHHWRAVHVPMSLRIHPQWTYVRNIVTSSIGANAISLDGISEEGIPTTADILDPSRFFGADGGDWRTNRSQIHQDIPIFLDPRRTSATIMREYRIRDHPHHKE